MSKPTYEQCVELIENQKIIISALTNEIAELKKKVKPEKKSASFRLALNRACAHYDYQWPKELSAGYMFFDGQRIQIDEFNEWANKFKELS